MASLRFLEANGFETGGRQRELGRKFDRWLHVIYLQRWVSPEGDAPPELK